MRCLKCNAELPEGARFCVVCGTKVENQPQYNMEPQPEVQQAQPDVQQIQPDMQQQWQNSNESQQFGGVSQTVPKQPKKPINYKLIVLICGIAAVVVIALVVVFVVLSNRKETISLEDYVTVTSSGYNGYGEVSINFDYDTYYSDLMDKCNLKFSSSNNDDDNDWSYYLSSLSSLDSSDSELFYTVYYATDYEADKKNGLSNGDIVTITFSYDEETAKEIGIKYKAENMEYEVADLGEIVEVDPFEDIEVNFSGISPNAYAEVVNNSTDYVIADLYFVLDTSNGLSIGDTVTVSIYDYSYEADYYAEYYGYVFTQTSKEYVCENVDYYASSSSDVTDEVLEQMKSQTEDVIEAYFATESSYISASSITYAGYYFLGYKGTSSYSDQNRIYIVYSVSVSSLDDSFSTTTVYMPVEFTDLIVYSDGTCYVDLTEHNSILGYTSLEYGWWDDVRGYDSINLLKNELVTSQKSDYTVDTVGDLE